MSQLKDYLKILADMCTPDTPHGKFYNAQYLASKDIKVSKCADVLSPQQILYIKKYIKPQKKQCYRNAALVAQYLNCEYVEGFTFCFIGIEHAFNKVGDKYIDVTKEFALREDPSQSEYVSIGEYSVDQLNEMLAKSGRYDSLYNYIYRTTQH